MPVPQAYVLVSALRHSRRRRCTRRGGTGATESHEAVAALADSARRLGTGVMGLVALDSDHALLGRTGEEGSVQRDILGRDLVTAAEMDAMTPAEREAAFGPSVATALSGLPAEYVAQLQADAAEVVARRDQVRRDVPHAS
jgi:hypothetical protein